MLCLQKKLNKGAARAKTKCVVTEAKNIYKKMQTLFKNC